MVTFSYLWLHSSLFHAHRRVFPIIWWEWPYNIINCSTLSALLTVLYIALVTAKCSCLYFLFHVIRCNDCANLMSQWWQSMHKWRRDKNPFLSSFIKLATVSERQAPPIHARPRLLNLKISSLGLAWIGGACLSETVASLIKLLKNGFLSLQQLCT